MTKRLRSLSPSSMASSESDPPVYSSVFPTRPNKRTDTCHVRCVTEQTAVQKSRSDITQLPSLSVFHQLLQLSTPVARDRTVPTEALPRVGAPSPFALDVACPTCAPMFAPAVSLKLRSLNWSPHADACAHVDGADLDPVVICGCRGRSSEMLRFVHI